MGEIKKKVEVPNDWSGISIRMYQRFEELKNKKLNKEEFNIELLAIVCGIENEMAKMMEVKSLNKVLKSLMFLEKEPETEGLQKRVEWDGVKYGFIPNLSEITMGEYVDIEGHCKQAHKNLHKIMSILYRQVTNKLNERYAIEPYNPEEFKEEVFKDCPMSIALSSLSFFFHLGKKLPVASVRYSREERERLRRKA